MPSLSLLEQRAIEAFTTAIETCLEDEVELPDHIWAIAQAPEHHVADLNQVAQQHPQLNAAYRMARKLLRKVEAERNKRMVPRDQVQLEQIQPLIELPTTLPRFPWENRGTPSAASDNLADAAEPSVSSEPSTHSDAPMASPVQPIIYRYTLPDNASPQAAIAFAKQVEAIRQSNPDWVVSFDRPSTGEAEAIVLIRKDEYYAATNAAYLTNRTLNQVVGPALNRIFSKTFTPTPQTF